MQNEALSLRSHRVLDGTPFGSILSYRLAMASPEPDGALEPRAISLFAHAVNAGPMWPYSMRSAIPWTCVPIGGPRAKSAAAILVIVNEPAIRMLAKALPNP
jgi:hypothetical protein